MSPCYLHSLDGILVPIENFISNFKLDSVNDILIDFQNTLVHQSLINALAHQWTRIHDVLDLLLCQWMFLLQTLLQDVFPRQLPVTTVVYLTIVLVRCNFLELIVRDKFESLTLLQEVFVRELVFELVDLLLESLLVTVFPIQLLSLCF